MKLKLFLTREIRGGYIVRDHFIIKRSKVISGTTAKRDNEPEWKIYFVDFG